MSDKWLRGGVFWTKFKVAFGRALEDAETIYDHKGPSYGDSWRTCSESFLEDRLKGEYQEWVDATIHLPTVTQRKELLDVVNVALMLITRTEELAKAEEIEEENPT